MPRAPAGMNAARPPRPDGGWSVSVRSVGKAVIVPITSGYLMHPAGVFDAKGNYVHEAVLWRGRPLLVPPPRPDVAERLAGRWLWGGVLHGHFGHFLTESTGRLWGIDAVKRAEETPLDGIVFLARRDLPDGRLARFHQTFLDLLGIDLPVHIVTAPTRVDLLDVPGQGFGLGPLITGTEVFRAFVQTRFARNVDAEGGADLYISRAGLGANLGGVVGARALERALAACGYEVFHPQDHPLEVQIARYKAARRIVAPDGSALHLVAMVGGPHQQVAVIKRRDSNGSTGIMQHLAAFLSRPPLVIDAITQNWIRSDRGAVDNFSFGELDFGLLGKMLAEAGFVPKGKSWPSLTPDAVRAEMDAAEAALGKLTFTPIPRGEPVPVHLTRAGQRAEKAARKVKKAEKLERKAGKSAREEGKSARQAAKAERKAKAADRQSGASAD